MFEGSEHLNHTVKQIQVKGMQVYYAELGGGPPVILLHGLGGSFRDWSENLRVIAQTHTVYALDVPGFGLSPVPSAEITFDLAYAAGFLNAFADELGLEHVSVIGHSMGGGISLKFAIDYPERASGLVLSNAAGLGRGIEWSIRFLSLPGIARLALPFVTKQTVRHVWESMLADPACATEERIEYTWQWFQRPGTHEFLERIYRKGVTICGQKDLLIQDLVNIEAPTLIVWGADDGVLPVSHAYIAHKSVDDSILHVLPECGHVPQIEKAKDFNRLTSEFLMSISY